MPPTGHGAVPDHKSGLPSPGDSVGSTMQHGSNFEEAPGHPRRPVIEYIYFLILEEAGVKEKRGKIESSTEG